MHKVKTKANGFYPVTLTDGVERRLHYTFYSLAWMEEAFGVSVDRWETDLNVGMAKESAVLVAAGLLDEGFDDWRAVARLLPMDPEELEPITRTAKEALDAVRTKKKPVRQAAASDG